MFEGDAVAFSVGHPLQLSQRYARVNHAAITPANEIRGEQAQNQHSPPLSFGYDVEAITRITF